MKICLAQTKPERGVIDANINNHLALIDSAISHGADCIIFPELSLTAYENSLAKELAVTKDDERLTVFEQLSSEGNITIGVGIPTKGEEGVHISMILFQPGQPRQVYSKKYLHEDEWPFFTPGENYTGLQINGTPVALAICYELSIPQHAQDAGKRGAPIYLTSVVKTAAGVEKAGKTLVDIAKTYNMTVLMVNSVGLCEDGLCAGGSAAWNGKGELLGQLDDLNEGLLLVNTDTQEVKVV